MGLRKSQTVRQKKEESQDLSRHSENKGSIDIVHFGHIMNSSSDPISIGTCEERVVTVLETFRSPKFLIHHDLESFKVNPENVAQR